MVRPSTVLFVAALVIVGSVVPAQVSAQSGSIDDIISQAFQEAEQQVAVAQAQAKAVASSTAKSTGSAAVSSSSATATGANGGAVRASSTSSSGTGLVGGVPPSTCKVLSQTNSNSCAQGQCCDVKQRTAACKGYLTATASVNNKLSTCCVVLLDTKYKNKPSLFCAAPYKKGTNYQLPSSAKVELAPNCSSASKNEAGSTRCTVEFATLPRGWTLPSSTLESAYIGNVNPCGSSYKKFTQKTLNTRTAQSSCT